MNRLFYVFLLFCSKDFIKYYKSLREKSALNPRVINSSATLAVLSLSGFLFVFVSVYAILWGKYDFYDWQSNTGVLFVLFFVFLYFYANIKSHESIVRAYSEGELVIGRLVELELRSSRGYHATYAYEISGESHRITKDGLSIFDVKKLYTNHEVLIIYARSSPGDAAFYHPGDFAIYNLDATKKRPKHAGLIVEPSIKRR